MNPRLLTELTYLALAVGLLGTEALARSPRSTVPTFGALVRRAMRHRSAQLGLVLAWWWLGWHFLLAL